MADPEGIVDTLATLGKTSDTSLAAQGVHASATTGQNLVRIGLMTDIPDQPIIGGIKDVMQGDGQFHRTQIGGKVAAGPGHGLDEKLCLLYTSRCV